MRQPRSAQDAVGWLRKRHRTLGLWVAFVTFTFCPQRLVPFVAKFTPDRRDDVARVSLFRSKDLTWPLTDALTGQHTVGLSLARVSGPPYYRLASKTADGQTTVQYRSTRDGQLLPDGEFRYAAELGQEFMAKLTTTVPGAPVPPAPKARRRPPTAAKLPASWPKPNGYWYPAARPRRPRPICLAPSW